MAEIEHFHAQDVKNLCNEYEREKECNNADLRIDPEKTKYNYTMLPRRMHYQLAYDLPKRVSELPHSNRKDLTVMSTWVVTLPQELKDADEATKRRFFDITFRYTQGLYGAENVMQGYVHMDEKTPHIHMPIVPVDRKTGRICRKHVFTPTELKAYHAGLEAIMEQEFGMKGLILNGRTKGNYTVKELKERTYKENELKEREQALDSREAKISERESRFEARIGNFDKWWDGITKEAEKPRIEANKAIEKANKVVDQLYDLSERMSKPYIEAGKKVPTGVANLIAIADNSRKTIDNAYRHNNEPVQKPKGFYDWEAEQERRKAKLSGIRFDSSPDSPDHDFQV